MLGSTTIQEFTNALSSKQPVPGGGGASALGGALAASLGQMVGNLTLGKKRYAEVEEEIKSLMLTLENLLVEFMALAEEDEKVFAPLAKAYGLPANTEEEKKEKDLVMEKNLLAASLVPIRIMEKSIKVIEVLEVLATKGSRMAVSDVGVGIQFARTALNGAVMNVYINTKSMKDREKAETLNDHATTLLREGTQKSDQIYAIVLKAIS